MIKEKICVDGIMIELQRKNVKNINLRIGRDKSITISVNNRVNLRKVEEFVKLKKDWINNSIDKMNKYSKIEVNPNKYVTGEKISILGKQYKMIVITDVKNEAFMQDDLIYLFTSDVLDYNKKKSIIDKMINNIALELFNETLNKMLELIKPYGVDRPQLKIRKMKSKWGSCNKVRNKITINLELVKTSEECLEYVILHELVHFLVSGHNKVFYNYLTILMPDWKTRKKTLNEKYLF